MHKRKEKEITSRHIFKNNVTLVGLQIALWRGWSLYKSGLQPGIF